MVVQKSDVVIVGGGPAGSSCASKLRSAGLDVLVLDKMAFPRDKPCAGWITPPVVASLQIDVRDYSHDHVWQPITGFRCGVIGGKQVELDYGEPISFGIRRCEFDTYLLGKSGARCQLNERVETIERAAGLWSVNRKFSAPLLVGAGGHFCPVARKLGMHRHSNGSVVVAQEIEFPIRADEMHRIRVEPEMPELFFCKDLLGYGWCFRKNGYLNIGLGRVGAKNLSAHVADFCKFLNTENKVSCDIPPRFHGHAYRLYDTAELEPFDNGVLLAGDSAGLAYPQSGEGIRPAVESGLLAADVIIKAEGDYRKERLAGYGTRLKERFGQHRVHPVLNMLPVAWLVHAASQLLATRWFARHVVMDRWFLRANQTPLLI